MINFSTLRSLTIPEGVVTQLTINGKIVFRKSRVPGVRYVSLGDSIAAGQGIRDEERYTDGDIYKTWQYGYPGLASTEIIEGNYTDLITKELENIHGADKVETISFARSGDTVEDLINKLSHDTVVSHLQNADIVTICIGANDILGAVSTDIIVDYLTTGSLAGMESEVDANLNRLDNDDETYSYRKLLDRLHEINPCATYVFTTVYNPYKYLWVQEGRDGFFGPLINTIPDTIAGIDIPGIDISGFLKDSILGTPAFVRFIERANNLGAWVESRVGRLNSILKTKVNNYKLIKFITTRCI
jgi:lysophospholipase L1-like esterase